MSSEQRDWFVDFYRKLSQFSPRASHPFSTSSTLSLITPSTSDEGMEAECKRLCAYNFPVSHQKLTSCGKLYDIGQNTSGAVGVALHNILGRCGSFIVHTCGMLAVGLYTESFVPMCKCVISLFSSSSTLSFHTLIPLLSSSLFLLLPSFPPPLLLPSYLSHPHRQCCCSQAVQHSVQNSPQLSRH